MGTEKDTELSRAFRTDGFVAVGRFVTQDGLAELTENVNRFIHNVLPRLPAEQVFYEDKSAPGTLKQIQQMGDHDQWFCELFENGPFRQLAESLLECRVIPKNLQYFNKPPGTGRPTPPHQDGFYFMLDPCEAVTMWLALDEADQQNGCVRYVCGSHQRGMRNHMHTETLGFSQGIADYPTALDRENEVALPARPGDLLVHHAMTIHRADGNSSTRPRRALGFIYYSERAREDAAAHAAYQRRLADHLRSQGRI